MLRIQFLVAILLAIVGTILGELRGASRVLKKEDGIEQRRYLPGDMGMGMGGGFGSVLGDGEKIIEAIDCIPAWSNNQRLQDAFNNPESDPECYQQNNCMGGACRWTGPSFMTNKMICDGNTFTTLQTVCNPNTNNQLIPSGGDWRTPPPGFGQGGTINIPSTGSTAQPPLTNVTAGYCDDVAGDEGRCGKESDCDGGCCFAAFCMCMPQIAVNNPLCVPDP